MNLTIKVNSHIQKHSPRGVLQKAILQNFANLTGKHLYWSLFFNKVAEFLFPFTDWILEYTFQIFTCFVICQVCILNSVKRPWWSFFAGTVNDLHHKCLKGSWTRLCIFYTSDISLREECTYSEFSGPYFPAFGLNIRTPYLSLFSLNARKYGPEKLRIRTFFTQRIFYNMMNPVRYNTRTQFDCYITFLQYSAAGFAKWSKYPQLWFCIKNFNLRKYWDKPFSIQLRGITENYITQHFWILTYYNPLIRTRIYAFRGVTVC